MPLHRIAWLVAWSSRRAPIQGLTIHLFTLIDISVGCQTINVMHLVSSLRFNCYVANKLSVAMPADIIVSPRVIWAIRMVSVTACISCTWGMTFWNSIHTGRYSVWFDVHFVCVKRIPQEHLKYHRNVYAVNYFVLYSVSFDYLLRIVVLCPFLLCLSFFSPPGSVLWWSDHV